MSERFSEERIWLKTSQLSCFFEPQTGFLRQVTANGCEIVRAIYGAVRDQNWNTIQPEIVLGRVETGEDHFHLEFQGACLAEGLAFNWEGIVEGKAGSVSFKFAGKAKSTFKKNRIGLCLLHPIDACAGKPCLIRSEGSQWAKSEFPLLIAPHQPFKELGAIAWEPQTGLRATVTFSGEVFETEDQRNWTDASYKTYSTRLEEPFPVEIKEGTSVNQVITIDLQSEKGQTIISGDGEEELIVVSGKGEKSLPLLGLCASSYALPLSENERTRLAALHLNHLRVDVRFDKPRWRELLKEATTDAERIGVRLQAALHLSGEEDLRAFAEAVNHQLMQDCLVFSQEKVAEPLLELASQLFPESAVVGGTNAYFTEVNRERPSARFPAAFSINPQVHAFDDLSIMENLEGQSEVIRSAQKICPKGVYVSPVSFRPRYNPNATALSPEPSEVLPFSVDQRQRTLFGAVWTVGSLARLLAADGIASLTYFETVGWKGLVEAEDGNPRPDLFNSLPGEIFPLYYIFHALAGATALFPLINPVPGKVAAIAFRKKGALHLILANLRSESCRVRFQLPANRVAVQAFDEEILPAAAEGRWPETTTLSLSDEEGALLLSGYSFAVLQCI